MGLEELRDYYIIKFELEGTLFSNTQERACPNHDGAKPENESIDNPLKAFSFYYALKERGISCKIFRYRELREITKPRFAREITLSELEEDIREFERLERS